MMEVADATIAMVPNAEGAKSLASSMFRPKRTACSTKRPLPSQTPPRNTCAFRPAPENSGKLFIFCFNCPAIDTNTYRPQPRIGPRQGASVRSPREVLAHPLPESHLSLCGEYFEDKHRAIFVGTNVD